MEHILWLAADSPEQLRATDVPRVMVEAYEQKCFEAFKEWLLSSNLSERTREEVESFTLADCQEYLE